MIDQPAADFSIKPTLTGEKVVLRPFIEDDLTALRVALKDPEVLKLTGSAHGDEAEADPDDSARGPSGRDRGLGTEAVRMIVGYGFEQLGLHRVSLQVYAFNPRARHLYEKVGFIAEGVLREELRYRDQWVDAIMMSILAHEWQRHHGRP